MDYLGQEIKMLNLDRGMHQKKMAQFDPTLVTMKLTDTIRRDGGELSRDGQTIK